MGTWDDNLAPEAREEWDAIVKYAREHTYTAMNESSVVMSLVPGGTPDVKFAMELGFSIMLDKPLVAVVAPGVKVPPKLLKFADVVIHTTADIDTEEGQAIIQDQLASALKELGLRDEA